MMRRLGLLLCASVTAAAADPNSGPVAVPEGGTAAPAPPPPPRELTAADVANDPPPGAESGRTDVEDGDSTARKIARGALFLPKTLFDLALQPVRGIVYANERFELEDRYYRTFFNDDRTIGLYPTATYASGFGFDFGARFVDRNVFGDHEHVAVQATYGGSSRQSYAVALKSGDRFGKIFDLELDGDWGRRPHDPFYGIGNGNATDTPPAMPIDPLVDPTAVETSYSEQLARAAAIGSFKLGGGASIRATGALTRLDIGVGDTDPPIDVVYNPMDLVGLGRIEHAYGELEARVDRRHRATAYEPRSVFSEGWLAAAYAGRVHRLNEGADFTRYGFELQQFFRVGVGPRVIALRLRADAVTGSLDEVPFTELPVLGGGAYLRGYPWLRFRDRVAAVGSAEYRWDVSRMLDAVVFSDVGRVYPSFRDLTFDDMRLDFGTGLELHGSTGGFVLEASLASSIDGGVFFQVSFNRIFDSDVRWR